MDNRKELWATANAIAWASSIVWFSLSGYLIALITHSGTIPDVFSSPVLNWLMLGPMAIISRVCIYLFYSRKIACFDGSFDMIAQKKYVIVNMALFCLWSFVLLTAPMLNIAISVSTGLFGSILVIFIGFFIGNYLIYGRVEGIQRNW